MVLWAWLQETRRVGCYNYAGCLSVPRVLSLYHGTEGWRLHQEPIAELAELRIGGWHRAVLPWCLLLPGMTAAPSNDYVTIFISGYAMLGKAAFIWMR